MKTLLLNPTNWDLMLNANGDIAVATDPYALAQDVASAMRLALGELWYDTSKGVPYRQKILGELPPASLIKLQLEKAAKTVVGVVNATCSITQFANRTLSAEVTVTSKKGSFVVTATPSTGLGNFILDVSRLG